MTRALGRSREGTDDRERTAPRLLALGFPGVAALSGAGVLLVAVADSVGRRGPAAGAAPDVLFWLGILLIAVPTTWRLAGARGTRLDRLGCCVAFGLALYLVKVVHSPVQFAFGDELAHWRTAADIATSGRLFDPNPLSLVSPSYPGLELVTVAVSQVSGLSLFAAGLVVGALERLVLVLALFLVVERLTASARVAGLATVLYAGNPNFTFWSAQFAYESLGIPLALLALYLTIRHVRARDPNAPFEAAAIVVVLAVVVTHHITSYVLALLLLTWAGVSRLRARGVAVTARQTPLLVALVAALAAVAWLLFAARQTIDYIGPVLGLAVQGLGRVLSGERPVKPLFAGDPELVAPVWERALAVAAVALVAAAIIGALVILWRATRRAGPRVAIRRHPVVGIFAIAAAAYLPLPLFRLVQGTTEIANRAGDFLFVAIGLVVGLATWIVARDPRIRRGARPATVGLATVALAGGIAIGTPRWARLPGTYVVSGDTRAIQPESQAASRWLLTTEGPDRGVVGDLTNTLLMGSYGRQDVIHGLSWVYFRPVFGSLELDSLRQAGVEFLVVDRRLTTALPVGGFYFESREPDANRHAVPLDATQLDRIDAAGVERIYDSGNIVIYAIPPRPAS